MVIKQFTHKGHVIELNHNGLYTVLSTMEKFDTLKAAKRSLQEYHYEWRAETNNLGWGRVFIAQGTNLAYVQHCAVNAHKGCFDIFKVRVYNR